MKKVTKLAAKGSRKVVSKAKSAAPASVRKSGKVVVRAKGSKAKAGKATAARAQVKWGTGINYIDTAKIVHVEPDCAGKRGASRERFAKYRKGSTVAAVLATKGGPRRDDVRYDLGHGFIRLQPAHTGGK